MNENMDQSHNELNKYIEQLRESEAQLKAANQQLKANEVIYKRNERKYRLLEDNIVDVIWVYNLTTSKFTYISPSVFHLRGFTVEEAMQQSFTDSLSRDSAKKINEVIPLRLEEFKNGSRKVHYDELQQIRKDGSTIWVEIVTTPRFGEDGTTEILGVSRNISERKEAEKEIIKLSTAVKQSPSVIVIADIVGNAEYVNPKFTELTGYTSEDVLHKNLKILNSGEQSEEEYATLWKTIISGKVWHGEFHNKKKNGELFWEAATIAPIFDKNGEIINYLKVAEDITKRKNAEENLVVALEKATEADRLKSVFLATISHELRTPLNAIIGFSDLISEEWPIEEILDFTKTINISGKQLLNIVNDIFDITIIDSGKSVIKNQKTNLIENIKEVNKAIKIEQRLLKKDNLDINLIIPNNTSELLIITDPFKVKQILINLLKNALKFTKQGYISYGYEIEVKNSIPYIKFFIKDTGIGIRKDKQKSIFKIFTQIDDSITRSYGGVGIGLSISKKLAKLLDGDIWFESEEGVGSTFYFTIPYLVDRATNNPNIPKIDSNSILKDKTILIVEDDQDSYDFLKIVLEQSGIKIVLAKNGKESIAICKDNPNIDMVLMDINMQVMNGYIATREIKKLRPKLPIIAQTALAIIGDREKTLEAGCDDYISKPINKDKLMEMINRLMV